MNKCINLITLEDTIEVAKTVARRYRELTGKPLGVTGEIGEVLAAQLLDLQLADARQVGYDAVGPDGRRVQIKSRCILPDSKPAQRVAESVLLKELISEGDDRVILRDSEGAYRFNSRLHNVKQLAAVLETLGREHRWAGLIERDTARVKEFYEQVFNHKSFTGRSGGMYGYEGLGCIYWHMVSKLLLAVQECYSQAVERGEHPDVIRALADAYYRVRDGLGFNKTPPQYGAFPTDPYSHTPGFAGARQPGMTGQVKEEILTRQIELGVIIEQGTLRFAPSLIRAEEFLKIESDFTYYRLDGHTGIIELPQGSIGFTFCQVPVIYLLTEEESSIAITFDDQTTTIEGDTLPQDISRLIFDRTGRVARIDVSILKSLVTC